MKKNARGKTTSVKYSVDNEFSYEPWTFDDKVDEVDTLVNENTDVSIIVLSVSYEL